MSRTKLDKLVGILKDAPDEIFIQPHNVPNAFVKHRTIAYYSLNNSK